MTTSRKKTAGVVVIVVGFAGLGFFLIPAFVMVLAEPLGVLVTSVALFAALFGLIFRLRYGKRSISLLLVLVLCALLSTVIFYCFFTAAGILGSYGVHFNPDAVNHESQSMNTVRFWYDGPQGKLIGPDITGDLLSVRKPYRTQDGHLEFVVRSPGAQTYTVRIQLLSPPKGNVAFQIMDPNATMLGIVYTLQKGLRGSP